MNFACKVDDLKTAELGTGGYIWNTHVFKGKNKTCDFISYNCDFISYNFNFNSVSLTIMTLFLHVSQHDFIF